MKTDLLTNAGTGNGPDTIWTGGRSVLLAEATFGGGSIKLQAKLPQGTYVDVTDGSLSAAGISKVLYLPPGTYRAVATTATACYASLMRV